MVDEELNRLPPDERAAFLAIRERQRRLSYIYQNYIQQLAAEGEESGYWINLVIDKIEEGTMTPIPYRNPVTGKEEIIGEKALDKRRYYRQKLITTKEYDEFMIYRGKCNKESDPEKLEDMTTRLYELGAKRFLDMGHDHYTKALKDEVRMAVDACIHTMSWNGHIGVDVPTDKDVYAEHVKAVGEERNKPRFACGICGQDFGLTSGTVQYKGKIVHPDCMIAQEKAGHPNIISWDDPPKDKYTPLSSDYPDIP